MDANELLQDATPEQRKWVLARIATTSDKDAAKIVGVHPVTVSRWPNKDKLDAAVTALLSEPQEAAMSIISDAVIEAARLKVQGLKSRKEPIAQAVASEILDRVMGKPTQRNEIKGSLVNIDMSTLTDEQLDRIIAGEDPIAVAASGSGGKGKAATGEG